MASGRNAAAEGLARLDAEAAALGIAFRLCRSARLGSVGEATAAGSAAAVFGRASHAWSPGASPAPRPGWVIAGRPAGRRTAGTIVRPPETDIDVHRGAKMIFA